MNCPNCNTDTAISFFQEVITCPYCEDTLDMDYYMCSQCGSTFKMVGEKMYSYVKFTKDEFENLFGGTKEEVMDRFSTDMMLDNINPCIKCGGLAFEVEEGVYKCSICGFEIEVQLDD